VKTFDDIKFNLNKRLSSAGEVGVYDISDENKVRIVIENAAGGNTVVVSGRIKGQSGFDELKTITGTSSEVINVSTYDEIKIECTAYASLSDHIQLLTSSFNGAGGSAIESIGVPSGDNLTEFDSFSITSSNGTVLISGDNVTKTIDLIVDPQAGAVDSVNTRTGNVVLDKTDVNLGNVDNTSDLDKPISTATQDALDLKYDASNPAGYITIGDVHVLSVNTYTGDVFLNKSDIGLGNADNTSDLDKPISTATQLALNNKVSTTGDTMNGQLRMLDATILVDGSITAGIPLTTNVEAGLIFTDSTDGSITSSSQLSTQDVSINRNDANSTTFNKSITLSTAEGAYLISATSNDFVNAIDTTINLGDTLLHYEKTDNNVNTIAYGSFGAGVFDIQTTLADNTYTDILGDSTGISMTSYDGNVTTSPLMPTLPEHVTVKQYVDDQDALKEDVANKTTDGTLSANSDTLYPSEKAVKTYVDATSGVSTASFDASTYYHELHVNYDFTGATSDGSPYKPFKTIQAAVNAAQAQNVGGNTAILVHLKKDITMIEDVVVNNAVANLYIMPAVYNNTDSSPMKIIGSLTISGSQTNRVRVQDIEFAPTSGYALIINDTNGRHLFQNCQFTNGGIAGQAGTGVNLTSTYKNFIEFIDCTIEGTVNVDGSPTSGTTVTMYRNRLGRANVIVNSPNIAVGMYDTYGIYGITHTAGALAITGMWGFAQTGFFNSTATLSGINFLSLANMSLQKPDLSFIPINKTGTCPYQLINVHRGETSDVLSGGRFVYGPTATDAGYKMAVSGNWSPGVSNVAGALDQLAANKISISQKGVANGVASLDGSGKVPSAQLPAYVDDVLEFANLAAFPVTGTTGIIYVALDTNKIYRWSGSTYIEISPSVGAVWGNITGTLSNQTDLQAALDAKVNTSMLVDEKEPTGFINRTDSSLSFSDGSRLFTIQPTAGSFSFYIKGTKYTKSTAQSLTIPNSAGNHYIYFNDSATLESTQVFTSDIIERYVFVAIVYWNTETSSHTYFAEERHGITMDGTTHAYLHTILGARYLSGLALQNFTIGDGDSNADAQFTSDSGSIRDEDILHTISAQTQIPILFRQGQYWRKKAADSFPLIYSGTAGYTGANGRPAFNQYVGGAWQLTEMLNSNYILVHFFATNDIDNKVVGIAGTQQYTNIPAARIGANSEISLLTDLPFAEFVPIGSVIFQSNTFTNTPKARVVQTDTGANYVDFRGTQVYTPAGEATDHGLLSGLSDDDHIQYHTDARGDARYVRKSAGDIAELSFSGANNQTSAADITGLVFSPSVVRSAKVIASVYVDASSDLYESIELEITNKSSTFVMSTSGSGDNSLVSFSITNAGQVQYTSGNYSGFASLTIKFRALTTSV
jgi:hypothetical protein